MRSVTWVQSKSHLFVNTADSFRERSHTHKSMPHVRPTGIFKPELWILWYKGCKLPVRRKRVFPKVRTQLQKPGCKTFRERANSRPDENHLTSHITISLDFDLLRLLETCAESSNSSHISIALDPCSGPLRGPLARV